MLVGESNYICLYCVRDTVRCNILTFRTFGCYLKSQCATCSMKLCHFYWKLHDVCRFMFILTRCCRWTTSLSLGANVQAWTKRHLNWL